MNYSLPGFSVHGILQAGILEWIAIPFSGGFSRPRNQTLVSCITGRFWRRQWEGCFHFSKPKDSCGWTPYMLNNSVIVCWHKSQKKKARSSFLLLFRNPAVSHSEPPWTAAHHCPCHCPSLALRVCSDSCPLSW